MSALKRIKRFTPALPALLWTFFTVALASWWLYFSLSLLHPESPLHQRYRHMLLWEGSFFLVVLALGGMAMVYLTVKERRRASQFREFVGAFSHDLKTSLARLRLDAENLQSNIASEKNPSFVAARMIEHTSLLERQLENALLLSQEKEIRFVSDRIALPSLRDSFKIRFPEVWFEGFDRGYLIGNQKALDLIAANLVHNARSHGEAHRLEVAVKPDGTDRLCLIFLDDGKGFNGNASLLGKNPGETYGKGSGLGLYLVRRLADWMNGRVRIQSRVGKGFEVSICLRGDLS